MSEHIVRLGSQNNYNTTLAGTVSPRKFIQLTDVNMIGVKNGDLVSYDEATKTFIPVTRPDFFPDELNIVYVSKNGNDNNSGRTIQEAKLTIDAAVGIASEGTVIRISPGNYIINNPITLPNQISLVGSSLREVSISGANPDDLFYVGNGDYIAEMSFVGNLKKGAAIFSFDPVSVRYINQSPYVQNCTNFIPESIGMKVDGKYAIGPIKSMVLDSYTQYNQGGIGISITNSGYAQLVSLFTICDDIAVYCGSGGACDLTNSNSSFGNYGLVADGVGPLQYIGTITSNESTNFDSFVVQIDNPTFEVTNALYDNKTGILTTYTSTPHNFNVGMGVSIVGLGFTCESGPGIVTYPSGNKGYIFTIDSIPSSDSFTTRVGISTLSHTYVSGGQVSLNIVKPFDGQVVYFNDLYSTVKNIKIENSGSGYSTPPLVTIDPPSTSWGIPASAVAEIRDGSIFNIELVSSGRGYTSTPTITISSPNTGINTAVASIEMLPTYHSVSGSTDISSGICTVFLNDNVPYEVGIGTEVHFYKQSRILASGHSLEYIGSGTDITKALPFSGGVPIQENETDARNGGLVIYTTTDQSGNFRIGDGVVINQQTGNISGRSYSKSLFSTMTPYILALGGE